MKTKKTYPINLEEAEKWKTKYNEMGDKIQNLFGQWDYAILISKSLEIDNPLYKRIQLDMEVIEKQIEFFQKLKEEYWRDFWKNRYGEDYE